MRRTIAALFLFGISFGYLEAAVVVYLRALHPIQNPNELFPLMTAQQLEASGPENKQRLIIELGREAATLLMLAGIALATGRNLYERLATFSIAFGLWDIFFYVFLKLMIQWPNSLFTWDILFLIPLPWVAPVIAPVLVALTMIGCGLYSLSRGGIPARPLHWAALIAGAAVIVLAFVWDFRNTTAGGMPQRFNWPLWTVGEAIGLTGFVFAARNREYRESRTPRDS